MFKDRAMGEDVTLLSSSEFAAPGRHQPWGTHVLVLIGTDTMERRILLGDEPILVGRVPPCSVVLSASAVSREHCRIELVDDHAEVTDLGSTNGTFVNGVRIAGRTAIQHGAVIQVGSYALTYECRTSRELEEAQAIEQDLQSASRYVQMLLPPPIREGTVRAEWLFVPSARLGGNAFGYRFLDAGTFAGYMIDVAGHGTEAAMHSVAIMNLLRQRAVAGADLAEPASVLAAMGQAFKPEQHNGMFFSCCYFALDVATRSLRYASAGRHPAFLRRPGEDDLVMLWSADLAVGLASEPRFHLQTMAAPPGSTLYLLSEGASESMSRGGGPGASDTLRALVGAGGQAGVPEPSRLYYAIQDALGPSGLNDDCSVVTFDF